MRDVSKLKFVCSAVCKQYQCEAKFYIDEAHPSGLRHLVVVYSDPARRDFLTGIPQDWNDALVENLILWPMKDADAPYPSWEVPARGFGRPVLFAWWEKSDA
jgi:hypothetical protein